MFVSDWMTKRVFTVSPEDSLTEAVSLIKEKRIKHLPVVEGERVVGVLSDRDIKEYTPSKGTSLDVYELHYLLAKTRVKQIMKTKVFTITPGTPIEEAAQVMHDNNIGCLPVVEEEKLVGIISDRDLFRVLVDITGARHKGVRVYVVLEDRPGSVKEVADVVRKHGYRIQSILTSYEGITEGFRKVVIRTKGKGDFESLRSELLGKYLSISIKPD